MCVSGAYLSCLQEDLPLLLLLPLFLLLVQLLKELELSTNIAALLITVVLLPTQCYTLAQKRLALIAGDIMAYMWTPTSYRRYLWFACMSFECHRQGLKWCFIILTLWQLKSCVCHVWNVLQIQAWSFFNKDIICKYDVCLVTLVPDYSHLRFIINVRWPGQMSFLDPRSSNVCLLKTTGKGEFKRLYVSWITLQTNLYGVALLLGYLGHFLQQGL